MHKLLFWFNVAVSTLNMWNVLYILRIIGKRLYKVIGKLLCLWITIFLKLFYMKKVYRYAKIIIFLD